MKTKTYYAQFDRFELALPQQAVKDCSHQGQCDDDVEWWSGQIERPIEITKEKLRAELKEYGAWEDFQLDCDASNWRRIIWLAAGNIKDELYEQGKKL